MNFENRQTTMKTKPTIENGRGNTPFYFKDSANDLAAGDIKQCVPFD